MVDFVDMDGNDLRSWRDGVGLTQEQLAAKLNVAINTVSRWEIGTRPIPPYLELALRQIKSEQKKETGR